VLIDRLAYSNRWRLLHPAVKGMLAGLGLAASLAAASPLVPLLVMAVMAGATIFGAGIPAGVYLRLLLVPAGFLLAGVPGLAVTMGPGDLPLFTPRFLDLQLGLSHAGLRQVTLVLARACGAISCLYLLALTTPMTEIIALLRRLRVPSLLLELMLLAYRQLFTFRATARKMTVAQQSRLGYATTINSLRSLAATSANLYLRIHRCTRLLHRALVSRGYEENLRWLERDVVLPAGQLALAAVTGGLLVALALLVPA
jgi:cobalt/nickel transport system permease protein